MSASLVILGATGDLTGRYLLPALAQVLPQIEGGLQLVGVAQDDLDTGAFRRQVDERLGQVTGDGGRDVHERLAGSAEYVRGDVTDAATLQAALDLAGRHGTGRDPVVVYLALPHVLFEGVVHALGACRLPEGLRVVVEKPFGEDLEGARRLNAALAAVLPEDRTFRVDHFLAKQTVLNILGLRFANRVFEPLWSSAHITGVDIVFDETVDAQARASYYDRSGALRDMVQNHLLQVLAYVAMEPPVSTAPADLSARKADVLRAVRTPSREALAATSLRGRYTRGEVPDGEGARTVDSYVDAPGIDPARETETYAEVVLSVDNWRWSGVPFRLRTGKALGARRREVVIHFAEVPHVVFAGAPPQRNVLRLQLDPDRMSLRVNVNGQGDPFELEPVDLDTDLAKQEPGPYGQLLLAVLDGDTRLSAHAAEAEEGWRIVEPVLAAWGDGVVPLLDYPAGSDGPVRPAPQG
ncbi:glucose-6-phosphate 1-dehydrogenase [Kineococcus xinjiangensis]|uniref:Glucose-6-phosphate 1-dehydrogenase n=1 Tax=Kineococcus xinjiangensis TaxID=512762 RepID=A0A2S6IT07_9ACTN|nr:glucose-6-phosphate dehydrogenase [Kineococcus xinjiangensis]PPK97301.1 glucose-6-phosphate 1-dehydrogenase [Kineococcus xinjiangensis]